MKGNEQRPIRANSLLREVVKKSPVGFLNSLGHYLSLKKSAGLFIPTGFSGKLTVTMWRDISGSAWCGIGNEDWALGMWPSIRQTAIQAARHIRPCWRYAIGTLRGSEPRKRDGEISPRSPGASDSGMADRHESPWMGVICFVKLVPTVCVSMFLLLLGVYVCLFWHGFLLWRDRGYKSRHAVFDCTMNLIY